ncbi:MAG TPA: ABC transporter permease [Fimbriimonadaceae bacterium]|jgi:ribose transport system permease protein
MAEARPWNTALRLLQRYQGLAGLALLFIAAHFLSSDFFVAQNWVNILKQLAIPGVLAIGMTFVVLTGGIDLSVGSHLALLNVILATWAKHNANIWLSCGYVILWGVLIGAFLGWLVGRLRMQPFIVTLGAMVTLRGIAYVYSDRSIVSGFGDRFDAFEKPFLGLPISGWILIALTLAAGLILSKTVLGRRIYALGGSETASTYSGVPVNRVRIAAYAMNGLCVAVAAILFTARSSSGTPSAGLGYELDAIAAVVVGGASLFGGVGDAFGTLVGALFIVCVNNLLQLRSVDTNIAQAWKGVIILLAVYMQTIGRKQPT